jgi:hypothetical protein
VRTVQAHPLPYPTQKVGPLLAAVIAMHRLRETETELDIKKVTAQACMPHTPSAHPLPLLFTSSFSPHIIRTINSWAPSLLCWPNSGVQRAPSSPANAHCKARNANTPLYLNAPIRNKIPLPRPTTIVTTHTHTRTHAHHRHVLHRHRLSCCCETVQIRTSVTRLVEQRCVTRRPPR